LKYSNCPSLDWSLIDLRVTGPVGLVVPLSSGDLQMSCARMRSPAMMISLEADISMKFCRNKPWFYFRSNRAYVFRTTAEKSKFYFP